MKYRKPLIVAVIIILVVIFIAIVLVNKKSAEAPVTNQGVPTELPVNNKPITMQPEMISVAEDSYILGISGFYYKSNTCYYEKYYLFFTLLYVGIFILILKTTLNKMLP